MSERIQQLLREADQCVKCGLCLPHCPTYQEAGQEAESPRGRIALAQGLARGELPFSDTLAGHLDRCLGCRACESACPAKVRYGRILHLTRAELGQQRRQTRTLRLLLELAQRPSRLRRLGRALRLYQRSGLAWLLRRSGVLRALRLARHEALLPELAPLPPLQARHPVGVPRGRVALFTGCVGNVLERHALDAAARVLSQLGFEVSAPQAQACCGAMHLHNGAIERAHALAQANVAAFADADAVVFLSSGCGAQLREYAELVADGAALAAKVHELSAFVDAHWLEQTTLRPLPARALVHEPCTLRNVVREPQAAYRLLTRIPRLDLTPLPGNERCCGAAGTHLLTQPQLAAALRAPKLDAITAARPEFVVSSNVGCAVHLRGGLDGMPPEVLHPIELLARQLDPDQELAS